VAEITIAQNAGGRGSAKWLGFVSEALVEGVVFRKRVGEVIKGQKAGCFVSRKIGRVSG
jgi:hypothetical protein